MSMETLDSANDVYRIVIYNDDKTPADFVERLLVEVFNKNPDQIKNLIQTIEKQGSFSCGEFPQGIAESFLLEATRRIQSAGHSLKIEKENLGDEKQCCSFCGKTSVSVKHLVAAEKASICDECIKLSSEAIAKKTGQKKFTFVFELLKDYFGELNTDEVVSTSRDYPARMRVDLQRTLNKELAPISEKCVGIHQQYRHEQLQFSELINNSKNPSRIAPVKYEEFDVGEEQPARCMANALWLVNNDERDGGIVVLLSVNDNYYGGKEIGLEITGTSNEETATFTAALFDKIEKGLKESSSYRGKILSLERSNHFDGKSKGITIHKLSTIEREQVILPEAILGLLDRTVIDFVSQRDMLKKKGLSTKRGVLFYGPPGTGKTHTIRYLATKLPEHTTLLITAEQVGLLDEYVALARLLQPSIVVIEDADLIAKRRESMDSVCEEVFLNKLLNEMDGLREDADILFILTTNRPDTLEDALANRPGRIDQSIEFPNPDDACRKKLLQMYGKDLKINADLFEDIVKRTEGVSAAFIKELIRRSAQIAFSREQFETVEFEDIDLALQEMLFNANKLNLSLLGASR